MCPEPEKSAQAAAKAETTKEVGLLDMAVKAFRAKDASQQETVKRTLKTLARELLKGEMLGSKKADQALKARIAAIDELLSTQLNEILHHADFQKLEASWRGLHYLVHQSNTGTMLKLRVFNSSKADLQKDLEDASEFDQSALFKKIYEEEYGTFGGAPYAALVGDFEFGNSAEDVDLLSRISQVAGAAHAPFIAASSPDMFGFENYTELGGPRDLSMIFDSVEYAKWKSFRESEDSRYVGLCLPHTLMRLPYGAKTKKVDAFDFEENVDGRDHSKYLWGNAAWSFGTRLTEAFDKYNWCVAIRGVEGGGLVQGLPTHTFKTDDGDVALKCPTEIAITDRREAELYKLGFVPLVHCKGTDYAAFFGAQSAHLAKKWSTDSANSNEVLSAQIQYLMISSRFAHYMKSIMRDKVGGFGTRKNVEDYLNKWISNYVLLTDDAGQETKAKFPLREARIDVEEIPGKPGSYRAKAFIKPHFQIEEIDISLRLVADLPPPAK